MACGLRRIITLRQPIKYNPITVLDTKGEDVTKRFQYAWSTDTLCWTSWVSYDDYLLIAKNIPGDFYLRILVDDILRGVFINGCEQTDTNICLYNSGERLFTQDLCNENIVDFYSSLDCALNLQEQLANSVICMLGIPCYYLKVDPDKETRDLTFKEFTVHNVTDIRQMKLMLQDGTMPSSNPQMTEFDFDWQNDWEVEIGKRAFANAFGDKEFPKQRDIIYVPMMKRLYEVNAAYDEKQDGLMWRSTTWKLALVKYNEKGNVEQGAFESIIDTWVVNTYDDVFTSNEREEQRRETGAGQIDQPRYVPNNLYSTVLTDPLRAMTTSLDNTNIGTIQVNNRSNVLARNCYIFRDPASEITYKPKLCGEDGTMVILIKSTKNFEKRPFISLGAYDVESDGTYLKFGTASAPLSSDWRLIVFRWSRSMFVFDVHTYTHKLRPGGNPSLPTMYYFEDSGGYTVEYDGVLNNECERIVKLYPGELVVGGIKIYDTYLADDALAEEMYKYTSTDERCVICDSVRPFEGGKGYSVR